MPSTWYSVWHRVGTGYHLEVTHGGVFRYFSFILLLTFHCQTATTTLPNTFKSQSLHAPTGLKRDVISCPGSNVPCDSPLSSWLPPQHAPLSQEVSPQPAALRCVLRWQLLQCGGCPLWGGDKVPATPFRQAPPHSARGYVGAGGVSAHYREVLLGLIVLHWEQW